MRKTKETDTVLLAPANSRMRHMYSTPLNSLKFSTNSIQQTQLHTQLCAKGDPRNNLDTPEQQKLAHYSHKTKPHSQTLQSNQSQHADHPEWSHKHCNGTIRILFLHTSKSLTLQRPKSSAWYSNRMKPQRQTLQRNSHLHAMQAKWNHTDRTPNHTSSQAQTRIIHIWHQMCWHCSYSNITCLPLFTVQSTLGQNSHMSILYTSYSIHTVSQKRWPLSGCCTPEDQRNEVVSFWTCRWEQKVIVTQCM